jgi:hypothetical protein
VTARPQPHRLATRATLARVTHARSRARARGRARRARVREHGALGAGLSTRLRGALGGFAIDEEPAWGHLVSHLASWLDRGG